MPCSHAGGSSFDRDEDSRELERRNFMKSALMIGGANATHTAIQRYGLSGTDGAAKPTGARDNRQHAWNAYLNLDERGLPDPPDYRVLLYLDYEGDGEPTPEDRAAVEAALAQLEAAFEWSADGLLFSVSYGRSYWDRFEDDLPEGARLLDDDEAAATMSRDGETPEIETADVLVDLASDHVANVLAAESALWGGVDDLAGVSIDATFEGIFEKPTDFPRRRTGFVAQPEDDEEPVDREGGAEPESDDAFLTMGFTTGREDSQPSEDHVTLYHDQVTDDGEARPPGQFAQGTVQHASRLEMDLASWYGDDLSARRRRMLGPFEGSGGGDAAAPDGGAGTGLGTTGTTGLESSGVTGLGPAADAPVRDADAETDAARETEETAGDEAVGHQQKLARARIDHGTRREGAPEDGSLAPLVLRRAVNTMDGEDEPLLPGAGEVDDEGRPAPERAAVQFVALMRYNEDVVTTREAMNDIEYTSPDGTIDHDHVDVEEGDHGIHEYIETTHRGSFLTPPLSLRSLPTPRALSADVAVEGDVEPGVATTATVRVAPGDGAFDADDLDADSLRFGAVAEVDQGRGASPVDHDVEGDDLVVEFPAGETGLEPDDDEARLFGKTDDGVAVTATVDVNTV